MSGFKWGHAPSHLDLEASLDFGIKLVWLWGWVCLICPATIVFNLKYYSVNSVFYLLLLFCLMKILLCNTYLYILFGECFNARS